MDHNVFKPVPLDTLAEARIYVYKELLHRK